MCQETVCVIILLINASADLNMLHYCLLDIHIYIYISGVKKLKMFTNTPTFLLELLQNNTGHSQTLYHNFFLPVGH